MRFLATTQPGSSRFFMMAPLLSSLQAGGHEVLVAAPRRFGSNIRRIGLTHETVGVDYLESSIAEAFPEIVQHLRDPHGALVRFVVDVLVRRTTQQSADDIAACIRRWKPDLLVHGANEFGGPIAAEAAGVPHMMLLAGLDNWFDRFGPVLSELDPFRNAAGLRSAEGDPEWLFAQGLILAEVPGWSARSLEDLSIVWLRPVSPDQPGGDFEWLNRLPRPLVHVSLGTVFNKNARPLFDALARGAAMVAASVVVTVGEDLDPDSFEGLPSTVHVRRYIPLAPLLKHTDAVLAHAGWGTLLACVEAGVPMGALVLGADHEYNAQILERAGCGFRLEPQSCFPESVAEATRRLLADPALRAGATRQQAALRGVPSPTDVAELLAKRFG
jgi:UDP:flavonoid glycosyltransferase YjiC (YdhE family)